MIRVWANASFVIISSFSDQYVPERGLMSVKIIWEHNTVYCNVTARIAIILETSKVAAPGH